MATKADEGSLQATSSLTCGVCLERFRGPKLLPCFHTFCEACVHKVAGTKPSFPCPTCRSVVVMPPGGTAELQANFYLEKDLAALQFETGTECDLCDKGKQASHKCVDCQQVFCSPCRRWHDAIQSCSAHTILPMAEAGDGEKRAIADDRKCVKHRTMPLLLFCCQCQMSICMQCKLTSHDGHETEDVVDTSERARGELRQEMDALARREHVLDALIQQTHQFQDDLDREKQAAEEEVDSRSNEATAMVAQAKKIALESVKTVAQNAANKVKKQAVPLTEKHAAVVAKREHLRQVIERGDDSEAVAFAAQLKAEEEEEGRNPKGRKAREELALERGTLCHEFKSRALKYTDVLAFVGTARDGPTLEMKALSSEAGSLLESVRTAPRPLQAASVQRSLPQHRAASGTQLSFIEIVYSRNPKATLTAMHLTPGGDVWLKVNPGGSVPLFALYDDDGRRLEVLFENVPASRFLVTREDDTVVCLSNGKWIRPGGEHDTLENFTALSGFISKSSTTFLLQSSSVFQVIFEGLTPKIGANAVFTNATSVNSRTGTVTQGFDVSSHGQFVAVATGDTAYVLDKTSTSTALRKYAVYQDPSKKTVSDVCFSFVDGQEILLVAFKELNSVRVVDHMDGCCLVRSLETDQCPLTAPSYLTTNHQGRVWVGCQGGKVVVMDV